MRITAPKSFVFESWEQNTLSYSGPKGERFLVTVLEEDLFRVRFWPEGTPRTTRTWMITDAEGKVPTEGRSRDDHSRFSLPAVHFDDTQEDRCVLETLCVRLELDRKDLQLSWFVPGTEAPFALDMGMRSYAYDSQSGALLHTMQRDRDERYYGLGEKSGALNKHGRRFRMFNLDAARYNAEHSDPLYKHFPLFTTFVPKHQVSYGLLYDNMGTSTFDMGSEHHNFYPPYRYVALEEGDLDYYLMFGPSLARVTEHIADLTGRMVMPPKWSLGYLGSTMTYTDAEDAQVQLRQFAALCEEHEIPCDMFHLSSGYTAGPDNKRYVFEWNRDRIPTPHEMVQDFHDANIKLAANVKPCLLTTHPRFDEVATKGGFVQSADADTPQLDIFWDGEGAHLDFTNPSTFQWWKDNLKEHLLAYGVDAIWNDNNEYTIWDDRARYHAWGERAFAGRWGRPLQTLLMAQASFEALEEHAPGQRPFVITRSGGPGVQRFAQSWTGDNDSNWHTLQYNIPMGLGLSLSGMPNIGHDVGGFFGEKPPAELFVRWVQNGIFHPRFTIHSWHDDGSVNEPWMYPEVLPIIRDTLRFRYRLIPYLYSLFHEAAQMGYPIIRPLVFHFPEDPMCWDESFDFLLGGHLMVASVWSPYTRSRSIYLPAGEGWFDWVTGEWFAGGQSIERPAPLEALPLLAREGAMIPMAKPMRYVGALPDDLREVHAFPGRKGSSQFLLYEDDGLSTAYKEGAYTELLLEMHYGPEEIELLYTPLHEGASLPYDALVFVFQKGETRQVKGADRVWEEEGRLKASLRIQQKGR